MSVYEQGFSIPEGLRRHLIGWGGRTRQCSVMKVVHSLARDYWNREFAESEAAEARKRVEEKAVRLATETLYRTTPYDDPELSDSNAGYLRSARPPEKLAWAEARLKQLGFAVQEQDRVKAYILEEDNRVVYADPRSDGEITFRVFKKPLSKRKPKKLSLSLYFSLQDRWKNDLNGKFQVRLQELLNR